MLKAVSPKQRTVSCQSRQTVAKIKRVGGGLSEAANLRMRSMKTTFRRGESLLLLDSVIFDRFFVQEHFSL